MGKSFYDIKRDLQSGQGIRSFGNFVKKEDIDNLKRFNFDLKNGKSYLQAYQDNLSNSHTYIKKQGVAIAELYKQQNSLNRQYKSGKIEQKEYNAQMTANKAQIQAITTQTEKLTVAQKASAVASKVAGVAMNLAFNIGVAVLINGIITLISKAVNHQKELAEKSKELGNIAKDTTKDVSSLYAEYLKLNEAVANGTGSKEDLKSATDNLISSLGLEGIAVEELTKKYNTLEEAITEISLEKLKEAHDNLVSSVATYKDELLKAGGNGFFGGKNTFEISNKSNDYFRRGINGDGVIEALQGIKGLKYTNDAEEGASVDYIRHSFELLGDPKTIDGIKQNYETLMDMQDALVAKFGSEHAGELYIYDEINNRLNDLKTAYENYTNEVNALNASAAKTAILEGLKGKELPKTQEEFDAFYDDLISKATNSNEELRQEFIGSEEEIKNSIKAALEGMSVFDEFTEIPAPVEVNVIPSVSADTSKIKSDFDKIKEEIEDIFKNTNIFDKVVESLNKGEVIDFDTMMSIVEVDSSLADKFTKTADGYTIAVGTLTGARQEYIKSTQEQLQADIALAKQTAITAEQNIKDLEAKRDALIESGISGKGEAELYEQYTSAIETEKQNLQDLNDVASKSSLYLSELASSALGTVSCFEKSQNAIGGMEEKTSLLKKAMTEMRDAGSISADTYAELASKGEDYVNCLEIQNGKLVLNTEKLKDLDTAALKTAITTNELAMAQINASMAGHEWSEALKEEYNNIELATAALRDKLNEYNNTKPDEDKSGNSSSNDDKPKSILDLETELARRQHEIKVGRMQEDEVYFNWLEKAYREAYKGLTGYQDDIYKYEEMVYDGRQKLAEDFYNKQKKKHENRVEELESQITVAENKSVDNNGNSLNPSEKFDYIRASYSDLIAENERRINEIMQSGIEGHEDEVKELERQIEEYADKLQDVFKDEIDYEIDYIKTLQDKYNDFIDSRIDRYEDEKKAIEDKYDAEIKSIDDTIDALKDKNDATSKAIELKKAEQDLENAKQRTRMVYGADGTVSYRQDTDKVEEAQQKVDDLKLEMLLDSLENQKKAKETEKDTALSKYDTMIADLEAQKASQDEFFEKTLDKLDNSVNPKPTEGIDSVINNVYSDPNEANEVKQGLKDVENAVNNGTEQAKDNANEVKKAENNTANSANKTDNKSQSANPKTATTANNNNNAVKTDVKQGGNSVNTNTSETADKKSDASNKQVVVYGEQVAVYDNGGENKQTEQTSNYDSFMKLVYSMSGKEPDGYERWKRGEYDEGNKLMSNIFSDDAFMGRAMKPFEDAMNSFNETVNKMNAVNATGQQPANITIGDININNPVGDTKQLAEAIKNELHKEALMEIPNAAMKTIHSNLR